MGHLAHPPIRDDLESNRWREYSWGTVSTLLHVLWVWCTIRAKEYLTISRVDELLDSKEVFWILQGWLAVKVRLKCMSSLLIMSGTEKMLWSDCSPEIRIFLTCDQFCHFSSRNMLDDNLKIWMIQSNPLSKWPKLSLCSVDKSLGDHSEIISRDRRLRVKWENNTTIDHSLKNLFCILIVWIDIPCRSSRVRRHSSRIVLHGDDLSFTSVDHQRSRLRLERYRHEWSCPTREIFAEFLSIRIYLLSIHDMARKEIGHDEYLSIVSLERRYSFEDRLWAGRLRIVGRSVPSTKVSVEIGRGMQSDEHKDNDK